MDVSDAERMKLLEPENDKLKKLLAEAMLENEVTKGILRKQSSGQPCSETTRSPF